MPARPLAICFDYGRTLVTIDHPGELLAGAGEKVLRFLEAAGPLASAGPESFGATVDALVDRLIDRAHGDDPLHEVDIYALYRRALEETLGLSCTRTQARRACELLQAPWEHSIKVDRAAADILPQLRARGIQLGLLSNAPYPAYLMHGMLERQGLARWFDVARFSSELGVRKPAPAAFAAMLLELGVQPHDAWFVGDEVEADIVGARAVGMTALLAPSSADHQAAGEALATWPDLLAILDATAPGDRG